MDKINKNDLLKLLTSLKDKNKLIAPVKAEKDIVFDYVNDVKDIVLDFTNTVKPAKEFFIPQREDILEFNNGKIKAVFSDEKRVFFGIRPCDLKGLCVMDPTFREGIEDPHYLEKRKNTVIIALACTTLCDENAFCESAKAGPVADGCFDLQLIPLGKNEYFVENGSKAGADIIDKNKQLFKKADKSDIKKMEDTKNKKINKKKVDLDLFLEKLKGRFNNKAYWKEASLTCLRCGACNYLCPSCFCNNMVDNTKKRYRCWDSCMFRGFTRQAANLIPRDELYTRFRQRLYHKYKWHKERYGVHMCTGCGRCVTYCPGLIPYIDIINEVSNSNGE